MDCAGICLGNTESDECDECDGNGYDQCDFDDDDQVKQIRNGLIFPKKIKNKEVRNLAEKYLSELKKSLNYQNNNSESWLE